MGKPNGRYLIPVRQADKSEMVTEMLASADRLGLPRHEVRTKSDGVEVPRAIAADLFPSLFPEEPAP